MNMQLVDWAIVFGLLIFITIMAAVTRKYTRSVADFLVANRCAGRYLITMSEAMQGVGAISVIALFQAYFQAGFTVIWWRSILLPSVFVIIGLSGYLIYRYRQTRTMTFGQFVEIRYSRRVRIFGGILAFTAGVINFGIFPAVGARFFIYFCGLPDSVSILGLSIGTFPLVMAGLLSIALSFVFLGGQIAVVVTDFLQGMFNNIAFIIMLILLLLTFKWSQISTALLDVPEGFSMVNPFQSTGHKDFNTWFFMMELFLFVYGYMVWQGNQGNNVSAKSPHEARMAKILTNVRMIAYFMVIAFLPICAYTFMHHADFSSGAAVVQGQLNAITDKAELKEMLVPLAMLQFLPKGAIGLFAAVMLAAFISTHDTYLHSFGTLFVQDVILPFKKKPFTPKQHMRVLKLSILGVAVFIFLFSLLFKLTQYIFMFQAVTASIWMGGAGSVLVGGLYWKRGTTAGAWSALIIGAVTAVAGIYVTNYVDNFPLNGMQIAFYSALLCIVAYVVVSLLGRKVYDMDRMLHRGKYAVKTDIAEGDRTKISPFRKLLGMGKEFTLGDRIIYVGSICWLVLWVAVFIVGTIYNTVHSVKPESWMLFWRYYIYISVVVGTFVTIWFILGGIRDLKDMFRVLKTVKRNELDDGRVVDHHSVADEVLLQSDTPPDS